MEPFEVIIIYSYFVAQLKNVKLFSLIFQDTFKEEIESLFGEVDDAAVKSLKEIYRDIYDTIYEKGYEHGEEVGRKNGYDEACKDAFGE